MGRTKPWPAGFNGLVGRVRAIPSQNRESLNGVAVSGWCYHVRWDFQRSIYSDSLYRESFEPCEVFEAEAAGGEQQRGHFEWWGSQRARAALAGLATGPVTPANMFAAVTVHIRALAAAMDVDGEAAAAPAGGGDGDAAAEPEPAAPGPVAAAAGPKRAAGGQAELPG